MVPRFFSGIGTVLSDVQPGRWQMVKMPLPAETTCRQFARIGTVSVCNHEHGWTQEGELIPAGRPADGRGHLVRHLLRSPSEKWDPLKRLTRHRALHEIDVVPLR